MFDTLAVAQQLAAGGVDRDQAEVIATAIHDGLEQGNHVTSDQFKAGLAEVRTEIANLDTRLSAQIGDLRTEQRTEIAGIRTEIASLETRLAVWFEGEWGALVTGRARPRVDESFWLFLRSRRAWQNVVVTEVVDGWPGHWRVRKRWFLDDGNDASRQAAA